MRAYLTLAAVALGTAAPALAQSADGEWTVDASLSLAAAAVEDESPLAPAGDGFLASASIVVSRSDTFDNGLTVGWRGEMRLDRDAGTRPAFAGVLGDCPAANTLCPRIAGAVGFLSPVSPATGLASAGPPADEDIFAAVESASVSLSGPWGRGILGYDTGAAARMDARAPTVLQRVSAFSPGLDPTALSVTRARNDVTGSSLKATYLSPVWFDVRLGASWTPKADQRSADFDPDFGGAGLGKAELENVWEGGAFFEHRFRANDVRVRTAITYAMADSGAGLVGFGDYEAWGAGLELEQGEWSGGLRWLSSNNAWNSGNGDYEAWEVGIVRQGSEWRVGIEGGWSEDQLTGIEGASWLLGASRRINDHLDLGLAWASSEAELLLLSGPSVGHTNARNNGLVVELTVRN
jgi:hypothetical protein